MTEPAEELERAIAAAKAQLGGTPMNGEVAPLLPEHLRQPFWNRAIDRFCKSEGINPEMTTEQMPKPFVLVRDVDVSGVSGTGVVAQGVEFADGTVALRWLSEWPTSVVFHERGIEAVKAVHGHSGATRLVFGNV